MTTNTTARRGFANLNLTSAAPQMYPVQLGNGQTIQLTLEAIKALQADATSAPAVKSAPKAKPIVAPVVAPVAKPEAEAAKPSVFRAGKGCMIGVPDGFFGANATTPPSGTILVNKKERASVVEGKAVLVPAHVQGYTAQNWKRNSKGTGWVAWNPRKSA
jgi:hypothetical protein